MEAYAPPQPPGQNHEVAFVGGVFEGDVDGAGADEAVSRGVVNVEGVLWADDFAVVLKRPAVRSYNHRFVKFRA